MVTVFFGTEEIRTSSEVKGIAESGGDCGGRDAWRFGMLTDSY